MKQNDFLAGIAEDEASYQSGPVECLGMTFESDDARREHFTAILREKLKDPEFRKIEGFPIGEDEDILNLSDPPYYTACPNPFIEQFVEQYGTPYDPDEEYSREPYAADVSEGKNNPIYNLHSYHTKVPHKAVMKYILHYTKPGDIIFDGFSGTGMTGVASQMCSDVRAIQDLGYKVLNKKRALSQDGEEVLIGDRYSICSDLSPIATFLSHSHSSFSSNKFRRLEFARFINELEEEFSHFYMTQDKEGNQITSDFYVWSEIYACPSCQEEGTLFDYAVDKTNYKLKSKFTCPNCKKQLSKDILEKCWEYESFTGEARKVIKTNLVEVVYKENKKTIRKAPERIDINNLVGDVDQSKCWFPVDEFPHGRQTRKVKNGSGITHTYQMFTPRALTVFSKAWSKSSDTPFKEIKNELLYLLSSVATLISRRERFRDGSGKGAQSGTLYVPSLQIEKIPFSVMKRKLKSFTDANLETSKRKSLVTLQSHQDLRNIKDNSIDYIFTDPPFGESLQYAELNHYHESWLKVKTALPNDCVMNYVHNKDLFFYKRLMEYSFKEAFRILKPGKWMTIEFSNSQASVWNAIQTSLQESGFVVAAVSALDKKQRSFNSVTTTTSVKQDLVISAYKPSKEIESHVNLAHDVKTVWLFIKSHLAKLIMPVSQDGDIQLVAERDPRILFDRVVAFFVQHGHPVPISSPEFQKGLKQKFKEKDGMIFLSEQLAEYEKIRVSAKQLRQMSIFVDGEASAIEWLRQQLNHRPMTYQDIHPLFLNELSGWKKNEKPLELRDMLEQNFLQYDGQDEVPSQIHSYLSTDHKDMRKLAKTDPKLIAKAKDRWYVADPSKAADLEKLRERALLKEFATYKDAKKKIKQPRGEALRAGFKKAWETQDYQQILDIAEKIPPAVLQEDEKLLMYFDNAQSMGGDDDFDW